MSEVLFFTEAGHGIGLGHISRIRALAGYFTENGISNKIYLNLKANTEQDFDDCEIVDWIIQKPWTKLQSPVTAIVDSYLSSASLIAQIREKCGMLIAIDDYNRIIYDADMIINPNVFFSSIDYSNQSAKCIGGESYLIFRRPFRNFWPMQPISGFVLISLGGSDYRGLLPKLCNLRDLCKKLLAICPEQSLLEKLKLEFPEVSFYSQLDAEQMLAAYQQASLVICGCGQSLHELALLGKPSIGICISHDQVANRDYYFTQRFLSEKLDWNDDQLIIKIRILMKNFFQKEPEYKFQLQVNPEENLNNYMRLISNENHIL